MHDKFKKFSDLDIPESFNKRFEDTLNNLPDKPHNYKHNYKKILCLSSILLVSTGVVFGISNNVYKYSPTKGIVLKSEQDIYIIDDKIYKKDLYGKDILFDIFIDVEAKKAVVNVDGEFHTPESTKSTLQINNKIYSNNRVTLNRLENTWGLVDSFESIEYESGDEVIYTIYLNDSDKVSFNANLKLANSTSDYENLGKTSISNGIPITVLTDEKDNNLAANFVSKIREQNMNISYGDTTGTLTFSGIMLVDANGKNVYGTRAISGGLVDNNKINFNTTNLVKPYKIIIPKIDIMFDIDDRELPKSEEIFLKIPQEDGSFDINMNLNLELSNKNIDNNNGKITLSKGHRYGNKVIVEVVYPENSFSQIVAERDTFLMKNELVGSTSIEDDGIKKHILEFDISSFTRTLKFKVSPATCSILGNWEFNID